MLIPVVIPPGMVRAGTEYMSRGRWYEGSLVRFFSNTIQPVGGWISVNADEQLTGRPSALLSWRPNATDVTRYLAIGTHTNLYAFDGAVIDDITPAGFVTGRSDAVEGLGYGAGPYGAEDYGTPRTPDGRVLDVSNWHLDAWGEYLVACATSDGKLYEWTLGAGVDAAAIANAPTNCVGLLTTYERMLLALGADGDVRKLKWSDQQDNTNWTPAPTNTSEERLLSTDGRIITAARAPNTHLIWTDVDVHSMSYIGPPFIYSVQKIGDACGIISANAKAQTSSFAVWMSQAGFWVYDGFVKPLPCDVHDYVFSDFNYVQQSKVCAGHNGEFGEFWWFYPSSGSTENDRYVTWNYRENHWTTGFLSRTAWVDRGVWQFAQAASADGYWFQHENGWTDDGAERTSAVYLLSGPLELVPGEQLTWVNQVLNDESSDSNFVDLTLLTRMTPEGAQYTDGPYSLDDATGYTDVRAQGRQWSIKLEENASGSWRLGTFRFDVKPAGRR